MPDTEASKPRRAAQLHAVFEWNPALPIDARQLRATAASQGALTQQEVDHLCFYGHRAALNVVTTAPATTQDREWVYRFGEWLAGHVGRFVNIRENELVLEIAEPAKRTVYTVAGIVVGKMGEDWSRLEDQNVLATRIKALVESGLRRHAERFGIQPPGFQFEVASPGKTMVIKFPILKGQMDVIIAKGVELVSNQKIGGIWTVGPFTGAGFGRLTWDMPAAPNGFLTPDEQQERLA